MKNWLFFNVVGIQDKLVEAWHVRSTGHINVLYNSIPRHL